MAWRIFRFIYAPVSNDNDSQDAQAGDGKLSMISLSGVSTSMYDYSSLTTERDDVALLKTTVSSEVASTASNDEGELHPRIEPRSSISRASREPRKRLQGWRFGVTVAACTALSVMLINLILLCVGGAEFYATIENGIGTVYGGDCEVVNYWSAALHVFINILSSLLLSASSYTMQCLCSPTRREIDFAHSRGDWLDIGLPSVRNIFGRISARRTLFWWVLALSSIPIHLLYNSTVFKSIDANIYEAFIVNTSFLNGNAVAEQRSELLSWFADNYTNSTAVQNLSNADCMTTYGSFFISGRSHVLLVANKAGSNQNRTDFETIGSYGLGTQKLDYSWICDDYNEFVDYSTGLCDVAGLRSEYTEHWKVHGYDIKYCLSKLETPHCRLQFSLPILAVVTAMNLCKCISMIWTLTRQYSPTLVTIGDAIASFLDHPDVLTQRRCLTNHDEISKGPLQWRLPGTKLPNINPLPIQYDEPVYRHWSSGASKGRWVFCVVLYIPTLTLTLALLMGSTLWTDTGQNPFSTGFGAVDPRALLNLQPSTGLISVVLIANLPQAVATFIYLTYNGLLTSMVLSDEWSRYYLRPKSLRTTTPRGNQRSTYYLQLPYKYSIPLLGVGTLIHWLVSESIFLAQIDIYDGAVFRSTSSQVGYSCLPLLLVFLLGFALIIAAYAIGCRRFATPMPVAAGCSVAIAAACHPPKDDLDAAYVAVSWGAVENEDPIEEIRHCCFTSKTTRELVPGCAYAGVG